MISRIKNIILTFRVKNFINDKDSWKYIKYDWDCGHSYSYIDHPLMDQVSDYPDLEGMMYTWLYDNDDCPPCGIYVKKDGTSSRGCCYEDDVNSVSETNDLINEIRSTVEDLVKDGKTSGTVEDNMKYLVQYVD